jgi:hypothetical protein
MHRPLSQPAGRATAGFVSRTVIWMHLAAATIRVWTHLSWSALVANAATTVGIIAAIIVAIRAGRTGSQQAAAAASRTEAAAALAEDNAQKITDAIRLLAQRPDELAAAHGVRWSMRNFENDRYILENVGDAQSGQVRVSAHESLYLDSPPVRLSSLVSL